MLTLILIILFFILVIILSIIYMIKLEKENTMLLKGIDKSEQQKIEYQRFLGEIVESYDENQFPEFQALMLKKIVNKAERKLKQGGINAGRKRKSEIECY